MTDPETNNTDVKLTRAQLFVLYLLAGICLSVAFLHARFPKDLALDDFTLKSIAASGLFILIGSVSEVTILGISLKLREAAKRDYHNALVANKDAQDLADSAAIASAGIGGSKPPSLKAGDLGSALTAESKVLANFDYASIARTEHVSKEASSSGGFVLSAKVTPLNDRLARIRLEVKSTAGAITSPVDFVLHPSFARSVITVLPTSGVATLRLIAWGAFVASAIVEHRVLLQIDLSDRSYGGAPDWTSR